MKALVTGATGLIGQELVPRLESPIVLSRNPERARELLGVETARWDPLEGPPAEAVFEGVDTVFHLAGDPVGKGRWTRAKKERIRASRVVGTRHLVEGLLGSPKPPQTLICASAIGFYGSRADDWLDESARPDASFLAQVCQQWEQAALEAQTSGVRVANIRTGIVLAAKGGALQSMLPLFKIGLGGRLGSGRQWMSWIHIEDLIALMLHVAIQPNIRGPVNAVAPAPATNREFTRELARLLGRPALLPTPALALRIALGEFATVLLSSQRVRPRVAIENGFHFRYPELSACLADILTSANPARSA